MQHSCKAAERELRHIEEMNKWGFIKTKIAVNKLQSGRNIKCLEVLLIEVDALLREAICQNDLLYVLSHSEPARSLILAEMEGTISMIPPQQHWNLVTGKGDETQITALCTKTTIHQGCLSLASFDRGVKTGRGNLPPIFCLLSCYDFWVGE